jgi:hypothetical protein
MKEVNLWKKYYLREDGLFYRKDLDAKKHLVRMAGNTPGFNKALYDKVRDKVTFVGAYTMGGTKFLIKRDDFENYRFTKAFAEPQYFVGRSRWTIVDGDEK